MAKLVNNHWQIKNAIRDLVNQENYPCVAAIRSFHHNDYRLGTYNHFGELTQRSNLRSDLLDYLASYQETNSPYYTFWAVFDDSNCIDEEEFEQKLWQELSSLTSLESRDNDRDPRFSMNPEDSSFCFSLGGQPFFVVGLHPTSSRLARRLPWPALVFNIYEQFEQLNQQGLYQPMIKTIRHRDTLFQGSANPMSVSYGDTWETIQFSGKNNASDWKCPFRFHRQLKN